MKLDANLVLSALRDAAITPISVGEESKVGFVVRVDLADAVATLATLRGADLGLDTLLDTFGRDTGEEIEVTYHLRASQGSADVYVRTSLAYGAILPSAFDVYPSCYMPERELCELYGLMLTGHPNPKRLLTTEGMLPLLRKTTPTRSREDLWTE